MDQKKTGQLLRCLRKEKGLTQEQLAEQFYVTSRTVSRWETGSNLPDVGMLIALAEFYDVDIREIIDGERKSEYMDQETKDTLKKVAAYATEGEKRAQFSVVNTALWISVALFAATVLFGNGQEGLLYGIVPEKLCDLIRITVYGIAACLVLFYLRVHSFLEKPSREPETVTGATVVSREVRSGTHMSGRSVMGYSFVVTFLTAQGQSLELYAYEEEFGGLKEGMTGTLAYQGRYFLSFTEKE